MAATTTVNNRESRCKRIYDFLFTINLFDEEVNLSLADQLISTRIFISLLTISLTIIISFTAFSIQTNTVTIQSPSEYTFKQLASEYPTTLSCPCQQSSIRQDQFISFNPQYHPICTSQLINQTFISSLSDIHMSDYWPLDYRIMIASHVQILALLCRTMKQTISDVVNEFSIGHIITDRILLPSAFDAQSDALVDQLKTTTVATSEYINDFLLFTIFQNGIYSALRTNYYIQFQLQSTNFVYIAALYSSLDTIDSCSCKQNGTCTYQAGFYNMTGRTGVNESTVFGDLTTDPPVLFNIPGIMVGCLPYTSLLQSTLECYYNQSCIDLIQTHIDHLSYISPLTVSYFAPNTTVNDLLDQLFIESWNNQSSFTNYFRACSPQSCTYSYNRRFNLIYVIVTIISLFGGLKIILFFSSPYILKLIRKLKCARQSNAQLPMIMIPESNPSFKNRLVSIFQQIYQQIITFNMFPFISNIHDGLYSTRLYIVFLVCGILILVFYESFSIRTRSITVSKPTLNEYERLYSQYSSTLVCPCTSLSVSYSSIMSIEPRYHQICSSDFVKNSAWLLYNNGITGDLFGLDFRFIGTGLFRILQTLCEVSSKTVANQLNVFNNTLFVSTQVLSNEIFNIQTSTLIRQFQPQVISSFTSLFDMIQNLTILNQFIIVGSSDIRLTLMETSDNPAIHAYDNDCSCGTSSSCTRPQGFYCTTPPCFIESARPNQTVPGLVVSCLPVGSLLLSSLECFFNQSCIETLIQWRSFEIPSSSIDPRVLNVTSLDPTINSRFSPSTIINTIAEQLFIEDWTNSTIFSAYYEQCAPDECVYTSEERFNIVYTISVVLGIIGGLSVALRILIPPIVKLFRHCKTRLNSERETIHSLTRIRQYIQTMNYYRKITLSQKSEESLIIHQQRIATRFYVILLILAMIIVLLFTGLNSQIHSVTISSPNQTTFQFLQSQYSSTLSCSCSQISIEYSTFLSIEPSSYHQICSSNFIDSTFINLLWGTEDASSYYLNIDAKILSTQFRLLSTLCTLAKDAINRKRENFFSKQFVTIEAITSYSFEIQMNSTLQSFIDQTPADFRRIHQYIIDMFHANQLHNLFNTNWKHSIPNQGDSVIMPTYPVSYNSCSCDTSSTCFKSSLVNNGIEVSLSGLVLGCLPVYGLRQSTLECLYDSQCLNILTIFVNNSNLPNPLNRSLTSRFSPISTTKFGTLIDELFVESWINSSNYSAYFSTCAPSTCRYSYTERNSVIYIITTILGLYGGLTVGLRFFVWNSLLIYWKIRQWFHQRRIQPNIVE